MPIGEEEVVVDAMASDAGEFIDVELVDNRNVDDEILD